MHRERREGVLRKREGEGREGDTPAKDGEREEKKKEKKDFHIYLTSASLLSVALKGGSLWLLYNF